MTTKKTKTSASKKKSTTSKTPSLKAEKAIERKIDKLGNALNEIFHLGGHSIQSGNEAPTPFLEVIMIALHLHNQLERDAKHQLGGMKLMCSCKEKEHFLPLMVYEDHCGA